MLARRLCHLRHVATCTTLCCAGLVAYLLRGNGAIRQPDLVPRSARWLLFHPALDFRTPTCNPASASFQLLSHHTCDPYAHLTSLVGWSTHHARHCYDTHPLTAQHTPKAVATTLLPRRITPKAILTTLS